MSAKWKVLCGDCTDLIYEAADKAGPFDLVFADPPFNIGQAYRDYEDRKMHMEFVNFTFQWTIQCWEVCRGVLALHGPDDLADMWLPLAIGKRMKRLAWLNWHYRFGQCTRHNWIDSRCHCLIYKGKKLKGDHTWNPDAVLVPSDRAAEYEDKRADPEDDSYEGGGERLPFTVWGIPSDGPNWGRVQGNNAERVPECPNQLPELYLARLIEAYTNPGDTILDPFGGSGTTATVAVALNRNVVTIDISASNCNDIRKRIRKGAVRV